MPTALCISSRWSAASWAYAELRVRSRAQWLRPKSVPMARAKASPTTRCWYDGEGICRQFGVDPPGVRVDELSHLLRAAVLDETGAARPGGGRTRWIGRQDDGVDRVAGSCDGRPPRGGASNSASAGFATAMRGRFDVGELDQLCCRRPVRSTRRATTCPSRSRAKRQRSGSEAALTGKGREANAVPCHGEVRNSASS